MGGAKGVVYPVDWIVASYNAILAMVWLGLADRSVQ
jgi:hypothetical protein